MILLVGLVLGALVAHTVGLGGVQQFSTTTASTTVMAIDVQNVTTTTTEFSVGTYTVPVSDVSVGLLGCSISQTTCTLLVHSSYQGSVTIAHGEGCLYLDYGTAATEADGCDSSPSAVLSYGGWATVNATVPGIGGNSTAGCPACAPTVGEELYGGLQIQVGTGNETASAPFAGEFTP